MGYATASVNASGSGKYVNATMTWDSNSESTVEVTVNVSSNGSWRLVQRGNSSNVYLSHSYATDSYSNTFTATDGGEYIFQVYCTVEESYYNNDFETSGFTVDSSDDSGGDSGNGDDDDNIESYILYLNEGEGTSLVAERTWAEHQEEGGFFGEMSNGDRIWMKDCLKITVTALEGYELDYYNHYILGSNYDLPYTFTNLTYPVVNGLVDTNVMCLASQGNATITTTATPISTVRIYDDSDKQWYRHSVFIYDKDSGWNRYTPFVYNDSSKEWERYS